MLSRVRYLLYREEKKALVLMRQNNFSWITAGGKDQVTIYLEAGVATILITETAQYAITSIIEEARMREEETVAQTAKSNSNASCPNNLTIYKNSHDRNKH